MATYENIVRSSNKEQPLASEDYVPRVMPARLGTLDMTALYLVVVFFINNAAGAAISGPAAFTYLALGAITFFLPCAIATAQLGHMFPHEGSLYNWTHKALGGYWSFFVGFCAWFPGVLVIVSGANILVTFIQGLNHNWLTQLWEQGAFITAVILFSGLIASRRMRTIQYIVNIVVGLIGVAVMLIGLAGILWLLTGHQSATNFGDLNAWSIKWGNSEGANIAQFGLITLAYLGVEVPLNMGGEISEHRVVTRHLFWGTLLTLLGYFIATFSLLVVRGNNVSNFDLIALVDAALGKFAGDITAIGILSFFAIIPVVYNCAFSRLLFVGAIDQRLPVGVGKLNRHRAPANAIILQTIAAAIFTLLTYFVVPHLANLGKPADLSLEVYSVTQATATLVWAISSAFFFFNLWMLFFRDRQYFHLHRIFPMPVLVICSIVGPLACFVAMIDTLLNSWIVQIPSSSWWYIVGGVTLLCLGIAAVGSMFASSKASWEHWES
ncbi:MAG: APC family permease [Ktedonobacteraceae bacterium]|nr:APC family permease [Ktedonobacteraceae bacterium]